MLARSSLLLLAGLMTCVPSIGQAPAQSDPGGWGAAKWGMKEVEIAQAFPGQTSRFTDPLDIAKRSIFGIAEIQLQRESALKYSVEFFFDEAGALKEVLITPKEYPDVAKMNLLGPLTDKYGMPHEAAPERNGRYTSYEWTWSFPTTRIRLTYSDSGYGSLDYQVKRPSGLI